MVDRAARQGLAVAVAVLLADQTSKVWLIDLLAADGGRSARLGPVFNLVMVWNPGVSFGLFASDSEAMRWILVAVSVAVAAGLVVWLVRGTNRWLAIALGLVIGGAVGNAIDRVVHGRVADFFDFHVGAWHWPAFNLADSAIVVGVAMLVLDSLFADRRSAKIKP